MNLALFDFDGTITRGDTFSPFLRFAVRRSRMLAGSVLLSPVVLGYRLQWVDACKARPIVARFGFQGERAAAVRDIGLKYATQVLPQTLRRRALERIDWHKAQGDDVVVVSASLDVYLRPWCETLGIACICTTLEEREGRLTGRYVHGDCSGVEKVRRIRERYDLHQYAVVYAYGDTTEDRDMLQLAHRRYYRWKEIDDCSALTDAGAADA
jgi:HAD superfamily hydrolase (TIGR01490 family)